MIEEDINSNVFQIIPIEDELESLKQEQLVGAGRDGIVYLRPNGQVVKVFFNLIHSDRLRSELIYIIQTSKFHNRVNYHGLKSVAC